MIREEEIKAAVEASPLLGGCNLSVSGMNVKYCHKGQIVSDRQKNEVKLEASGDPQGSGRLCETPHCLPESPQDVPYGPGTADHGL